MQEIKNMTMPGERKFTAVIHNLLNEPVDCIVNASNGALAHSRGVSAAIAKAAGIDLEREGVNILRERGKIPVGDAVVTTAGNLPFKGVVHAVGPKRGEGDEENKLVQTVQSAFMRATEKGWESLSFPAISSGIYAVPPEVCARAYVRSVIEFFEDHPSSSLKEIRLTLVKGLLADIVKNEMEVMERKKYK